MSTAKKPLTEIQKLAFACLSMREVCHEHGGAYRALGQAVGHAVLGEQALAVSRASAGVCGALIETRDRPKDEAIVLRHGPGFIAMVSRVGRENWLALPNGSV